MQDRILFIFLYIFFQTTLAYELDEYYCKYEQGNYLVCRHCADLNDENCEKPIESEPCQCDNIEIFDSKCRYLLFAIFFFTKHLPLLFDSLIPKLVTSTDFENYTVTFQN